MKRIDWLCSLHGEALKKAVIEQSMPCYTCKFTPDTCDDNEWCHELHRNYWEDDVDDNAH